MNAAFKIPVEAGRVRLWEREGFAPSAPCPLPSTLCHKGGGGGTSESVTETSNIDKSLTTESGEILALQDSTVTVADGGTLTIISKDPGAAIAAIDAVRSQSASVISAVSNLSEQANQSARLVAQSQEKFVETASGQKAVTTAVAIIGGIALLITLPAILKNK